MKSNNRRSRVGFTMLELTVATAMLAMLTASSMVLVRTSYTAWNRHEDDHSQRQAAIAVLRHIGRRIRQAKAIMAISAASDTSGSLSLLTTDGNVLVWEHDATTKEVRYGITTATNVLAKGIEELTFVGVKVDGVQQTTEVGLIHLVQCSTKFNLVRPTSNELVSMSSRAWLRAW